MKHLMVSSLLVSALVTASNAEDIIYNPYQDVGYNKAPNWECAQGLCCDGVYFYFAGHHDKTGEFADIHKIRMFDNKEVATFVHKSPMHTPGMDWFESHDSLLTCSYGKKIKPYVWEVDKNTGECLGKWDCPEIGFGVGGLIAWEKDNDIILFTSIDDSANIAFTRMTLLPDGKFIDHGTWYYTKNNDRPNLGVPQGMDYKDGYVWFLADNPKNVNLNPHSIYLLKLEDNAEKSVTVCKEYRVDFSRETEGLTFDLSENLYFGSADERIYKLNAKGSELKHCLPEK